MKKKIVVFCFLVVSSNVYSQEMVNYNNMMDSLLITFDQKIVNDLALEGFTISNQLFYNIQLEGYWLIYEVFFTPKCSYILGWWDTSAYLKKKWYRQSNDFRFRKNMYYSTFRRYIENNNELPYDIIKYFKYQFITPYKGSTEDNAIYGEYNFSVSKEKGFEIIEKKIEILQSKKEILRKYQSNF